MFRAETARVRLYFWPELSPPNGPPLPPPPPRPPPPPGRPNVPPAIGPPPCALPAVSFFFPNPNVLLKRRFKENRAGPVPQLIGTIELAFVSLQFKATLCATFALARAVCNCADVGRSLKIESPFKSCPSVTLKGDPELAIRNGLSRN